MFRTEEDEFGRFRIYYQCPTSELSNTPLPDHNDFAESGETHQACPENIASGLRMPNVLIDGLSSLIGLFMNVTVVFFIQWFCSGTGQKSTANAQHLIDDVILHEDFEANNLQGINLARELKKIDTFKSSLEDQGWKRGSVKISMPCPKEKVSESKAVEFKIDSLLYWDLTDIIKNACQDEVTADSFHMTPFQEMWRPLGSMSLIRLYGEAYTLDEMINMYEEVQNIPPHPDYPDAENVVELSPYSDATMLAQFGTTFLWPLYIYFSNLSKYICYQPSSHAAHHMAYFPSVRPIHTTSHATCIVMNMIQLPNSFCDWYQDTFGVVLSEATITHCKRELIQALWLLILSAPGFVEAYQQGIFIRFADQVIHCVFPQFFAYMANYPEK